MDEVDAKIFKIDTVIRRVRREVIRATIKHAPMHSPHEGYSVILEELDELWDEVKTQTGGRTPEAFKEAIQIAAMGVRYVVDLDT